MAHFQGSHPALLFRCRRTDVAGQLPGRQDVRPCLTSGIEVVGGRLWSSWGALRRPTDGPTAVERLLPAPVDQPKQAGSGLGSTHYELSDLGPVPSVLVCLSSSGGFPHLSRRSWTTAEDEAKETTTETRPLSTPPGALVLRRANQPLVLADRRAQRVLGSRRPPCGQSPPTATSVIDHPNHLVDPLCHSASRRCSEPATLAEHA